MVVWFPYFCPSFLEEKVVFPKMDVIYCRSLWKDVTDFEGLLPWPEIGFPVCENNEVSMNLHSTCLNLNDMTSDIVGAQVAMNDVV